MGLLYGKIDELENVNFELDSQLAEITHEKNTSQSNSQHTQAKMEEIHRKLKATNEVLYEKEAQLNVIKINSDLKENENTSLLSQLDQLSKSLMQTLTFRENKLNVVDIWLNHRNVGQIMTI